MSTIRFKIGVNAWECKCGAIVATGRVCSCGARQINNVVEKNMHKTDPAVKQGRLRQQASLPKAIYSEGKIIQEMKTMNEISELLSQIARRDRWLERLRAQYDELYKQHNALQEELSRVGKERDSLQGDVLKLKAKVADLEAKLPSEPNIILTR